MKYLVRCIVVALVMVACSAVGYADEVPLPDVTTTDLHFVGPGGVATDPVYPGGEFVLRGKFVNLGTAPSQPHAAIVSGDAGGGIGLGVPALNPGEEHAWEVRRPVAYGTPPGLYDIRITVSRGLPDSDTTNDLAIAIVYVGRGPLPDLAFEGAGITGAGASAALPVAPGAAVTIDGTSVNRGGDLADNGYVQYVMRDPLGSVIAQGGFAGRHLLPRETQAWRISAVVPAGSTPGTYTLLLILDDAEVVQEADETNNTRLLNLYVDTRPPDTAPPTVTINGVTEGATFDLGSLPAITCSASDAESGLSGDPVLAITGGNPDGTGLFVATCTAADASGNQASASVGYWVYYPVIGGGFQGSVKNPPQLNMGTAGKTYLIKWQLADGEGGFISSLATVQSIAYKATTCTEYATNPQGALTALPAGGTSVRYDSTDTVFLYNWKTPSVAGCYTFFLQLSDGRLMTAHFSLK